MVRLRIPIGEPIVGLGAPSSIGVAEFVAPSVLATVGLEPIDVGILQQVVALLDPPLNRLSRCAIGQKGAGKPPARFRYSELSPSVIA